MAQVFKRIKTIMSWIVGIVVVILSYLGFTSLTDKSDERKEESDKRKEEVSDIEKQQEKDNDTVEEIRKRHNDRLDMWLILGLILSMAVLSILYPIEALGAPDNYDDLLEEYKETREKWREAERDIEELLEIIDRKDEQIDRMRELYDMEREAFLEEVDRNTRSISIGGGVSYPPLHPDYSAFELELSYQF